MSKSVETRGSSPDVGSSPTGSMVLTGSNPALTLASVTQLVETRICNPEVVGSNPSAGCIGSIRRAPMKTINSKIGLIPCSLTSYSHEEIMKIHGFDQEEELIREIAEEIKAEIAKR